MPEKRVDPKSRAVVYKRTEEEQKLVDMQKEIDELKKLIKSNSKTTKK
jgi:hypothetical protein